ncbi:hypothetical protein CEXT_452701 [Caerostris extrusa]|uniref:Uncharacterized protein n=1 Tax=Caerostris extrusa TaxID=172846 RepID=A0AAV4VC15_CAEEX|nr:hypothetical protein CEXT_452701 [Caerostris extrusa]
MGAAPKTKEKVEDSGMFNLRRLMWMVLPMICINRRKVQEIWSGGFDLGTGVSFFRLCVVNFEVPAALDNANDAIDADNANDADKMMLMMLEMLMMLRDANDDKDVKDAGIAYDAR